MPTRVCRNCSTLAETDKPFCPECGTSYVAESPPSAPPPQTMAAGPPGAPASVSASGRGFTIAAFVCAFVALWFFPPLFGVAGLVLAGVGMSKGDPLAKGAMAAAVVGLLVGMIVGMLMWM